MHARSSTDDKSERKRARRTVLMVMSCCVYTVADLSAAEAFVRANQLDSTMPKISWSLYRNVSLSLLAPMSPRFTACPP